MTRSFGTALLLVVWIMGPGRTARAQEAVPAAPGYADAAKALEAFISAEMEAKEVPGLSIALVAGDRVVWARGFGHADPDKRARATAETLYPLGSVSKPLTALLVLQLAREGKLALTDPVTKHVPGFKPRSAFDEPVTLRHLLAHCSGLVREPPVGSYFSPGTATRAEMVASLNGTDLVYAPGTRYKYSNAAFALAGHVAEAADKRSFEDAMAARVFKPLNMTTATYRPTKDARAGLATGQGWARYGKTFAVPANEYRAMAPAGGAVSSVLDASKLIGALFPDSKGPFHADDLKAAFAPQFPNIKAERTYGLGFALTDFQGTKRVGHGGAVNGCVTEFAVLPGDRVGVVVCATKESANLFTRRIADAALGHALAVKANKLLPALEASAPLPGGLAKRLVGRYRAGTDVIDVQASGDRAWLAPLAGGPLQELRVLKDILIVDDALSFGTKVRVKPNGLEIEGTLYEKIDAPAPKAVPEKWLGLIGEYGTEENPLVVLEKDGRLHLLIEWFYLYPLAEEGEDKFRLPDSGLYPGEAVVFHRAPGGKKSDAVTAAAIKFPRRHLDGEDGKTFRIKPQRPLADLRKEALEAKPPVEKGDFRKPELVDLATVDPTFKFDIRYATDNNFMGAPLYTSAKAFLQRPAADALKRASKRLSEHGYGVLVFDCYRPWYVTKMFWEATPEKQRVFVADPSRGSRHNRGCAADITLYDLKTGRPVEMVSGFDEFSDRAYPDYPGGTSLQRWHRQLLRDAMEAEGFTVYEAEWWHFDFKDWRKYPILNDRFEDLR